MKLLVLISGPIAVGKSSVAAELIAIYGFGRISTGKFLAEKAHKEGVKGDRSGLQIVGDALDEKTDFQWVVENVAVPTIESKRDVERWLLDSVRKERQVHHFRARYGPRILHVHLTAPESILKERYETRLSKGEEYAGNTPYEVAIQHPNEISSRGLIDVADLVIDIKGKTPGEVAQGIVVQRL
jgi:adenylate kinase family enzyme